MGQMLNFPEIPFFPHERYTHTDIVRHIVIGTITISIFLVTFLAMARNSTSVAPQLFYFPILYTTYFYPRRGLVVAASCAVAYGLVGSYFMYPDLQAVQFVIGQAALFLCVGVAAGFLLKNRVPGYGSAVSESEAVRRMIDGGENDKVEFKLAALWSTELTNEELAGSTSIEVKRYKKNASKFTIARSIAGFLNTEGGDLLLGIREDRRKNTVEVTGIESEYAKLQENDRNPDGYRRMIMDSVIRKYIPDAVAMASRTIHITCPVIDGRTICRIHITGAVKPMLVDVGNEELFFIRVDAETRLISGKTLTRYILSRFSAEKPPK
jgi:hypothetical protein